MSFPIALQQAAIPMHHASLFSRLGQCLRSRASRLPGSIYLWCGTLLLATSNALVQRLTTLGAAHLVDGRNPISACNVLFVSNLCALAVLLPVFRTQLRPACLRSLSRSDWGVLLGVSVLSGAIAPALIFLALSQTLVSNVILVGRLEPPLILGLSLWLLPIRLHRWEVVGTLLSLVGISVTIALLPPLSTPSMSPLASNSGALLAALGTVAAAIATVISKARLGHLPLGLVTVVRLGVGTIVFWGLAMLLYGPAHFQDVTAPVLWPWMALYGVGIVAIGQLCWFRGLSTTSPSTAALVNSFNPVAGMVAAYFILGESPLLAHYAGGSIILLGLLMHQIGIWQHPSGATPTLKPMPPRKPQRGLKRFEGVIQRHRA